MQLIDNSGKKYYQELGFDQYGFSTEEKHQICDYYNYCQKNSDVNRSIHPISKEDFEAMAYYNAFVPDICLLWQDGGSNYAGVYYTGCLRGKVMFLTHSEPNYAPLFRNISSFINGVKAGTIEELSIPAFGLGDYPAKTLPEAEQEHNYTLARQYLDRLPTISDEDEYYQTALTAWYLMPAEHLDLLIPLMQSNNMYIEQDIADIFVFHNYQAAIPALRDAAQTGSSYIRNSAKRALAKLRN